MKKEKILYLCGIILVMLLIFNGCSEDPEMALAKKALKYVNQEAHTTYKVNDLDFVAINYIDDDVNQRLDNPIPNAIYVEFCDNSKDNIYMVKMEDGKPTAYYFIFNSLSLANRTMFTNDPETDPMDVSAAGGMAFNRKKATVLILQ